MDRRAAQAVRRFGSFELDLDAERLLKNGRTTRIQPQPFRLLCLLTNRPGVLVTREEIQAALWPGDTFVDFDQGVNHAIRELRAALGDVAESPRFIQTLPRRGYRFIAPVEGVPPPAQPAGVQAPAATAPLQARDRAAAKFGIAFVVGVAAALLLLVYVALQLRHDAAAAVSPTLVVQPFSAVADPALGVGLASAISERLAGQQIATVAPGRTGAATHVVDGEVAITGSHVDVMVRLRERSNRIVWSDRIQVRADELFDVEAVIAERVVGALRLQLASAGQARLRQRYTKNGPAYAAYLRGRAGMATYTQEGTLAAVRAFEEALRLDAAYTLARAGLAMASADMCLRFAPASEVERWGERAESEARAALALDPDLAEAHLARAAVARKHEFDWNATVAASRRALALNPNLDQARFFVAAAYYHIGYMQEALIEMEKGRSLRGVDAVEPIRIEALVALFSGNFAPAQARLEDVSRLSSQPIGDTYLALASFYNGNVQRARTMLQTLSAHRSASTAARASAALSSIMAAQGEGRGARLLIDRVLAGEYRDHHVAYSLGASFAQLGDEDEAIKWLRTAADTGFPCVPFFERDPLLEPLRQRAQFAELLAYVRSRREAALRH